jgi:hypothetical protein
MQLGQPLLVMERPSKVCRQPASRQPQQDETHSVQTTLQLRSGHVHGGRDEHGDNAWRSPRRRSRPGSSCVPALGRGEAAVRHSGRAKLLAQFGELDPGHPGAFAGQDVENWMDGVRLPHQRATSQGRRSGQRG